MEPCSDPYESPESGEPRRGLGAEYCAETSAKELGTKCPLEQLGKTTCPPTYAPSSPHRPSEPRVPLQLSEPRCAPTQLIEPRKELGKPRCAPKQLGKPRCAPKQLVEPTADYQGCLRQRV